MEGTSESKKILDTFLPKINVNEAAARLEKIIFGIIGKKSYG